METDRVSLWVATTPMPEAPRLTGDEHADVVVVGAGIVGLCTALILQREGVRVALVEAGELASGASGYTTAKLTTQHGLIYSRLVEDLGRERAEMYARANEAGMDFIASQTQLLGIDCELETLPAFVWAASDSECERCMDESSVAASLGLPATFVSRVGLPVENLGAVRFDSQMQFHPRRFLAGIARSFVEMGGRIYTHSRVLDVECENGHVIARCESGSVRAQRAVIATHLPIINRSLHFAMNRYRRSYVVAVECDLDLGGMYISVSGLHSGEGGRSLRSAREGKRRLLLVGGEGHEVGHLDADPYQVLERWGIDELGAGPAQYTWSTQDPFSLDGRPFVGQLLDRGQRGYERVYGATGFGGWGMSNGAAAALMISSLILKGHCQWLEAFDARRRMTLAKPASLAQGARTAASVVRAHLPLTGHAQIDEILPGEGQVVSVGAHRVAAAREADGRLRAVSAVCTHMGCEVAFNGAERSWDCPCHGSRFDLDGRVIEGPATRSLEVIEVVHASPDVQVAPSAAVQGG
jgi:glycine/D-amino acid oxidase-like deaminating enzyme/nitrite reductase/ring-hydroxylating ferredoxin subunit